MMTHQSTKLIFPKFYAAPIFLAICLKSGADAFFEVNSVKYLYFFLLLFGVFFLRTGRGFGGQKSKVSGDLQSKLWVFVIIYFSFLTMLMVFQNGSPQIIFKIVSPFIFFGLVAAASDESLPLAIAIGAALNILANAALIPFDYGWVYWGAVHTFKGFYLFKTDLSFSLSTSLLAFAAWNRYRLTPIYLVLTLLVVIQVVLANSRLNYVTLAIVLIFVALKNGAKPSTLLMYGGFLSVLMGVAFFLYDSSKVLTLDTSNMGGFTQGRDRVIEILIKYGLATYGPLELLFGRGLYADILIFMQNISDGMAHGAHNEYLYLLITQGLTGAGLNLVGWILLYKISRSAGPREWASGLTLVAFLLYLSQGLTATVSPFALKTWPIATILLLIFSSEDRKEEVVPEKRRKKGWHGALAN